MVFIIRVRGRTAMKRLLFASENASWNDLQLQISDLFGVPAAQQKLSRTPLHEAKVYHSTQRVMLDSTLRTRCTQHCLSL